MEEKSGGEKMKKTSLFSQRRSYNPEVIGKRINEIRREKQRRKKEKRRNRK